MKGKLRKTKLDVTRKLEPFTLIKEGNIELLLNLIDSEPTVLTTVRYPSGWSLLHRAAEEGQTDICQLLLQRGMNVNIKTVWGWFTPLHLALGQGWKETALFLCHAGGDIYTKSKCQKNVMEYAIHRGYDVVAKEFYFILQHEREVKISQERKFEREKRANRILPLTTLDEEDTPNLASWGGEGVVVEAEKEDERSVDRQSFGDRSVTSATSDITR
jgi:hypothetical protein